MSATALSPRRITGRGLSPAASADWEPASRGELSAVIAYFVGLVALTDIFNVRLGMEYMTLAILVPPLFITRRPRQFLRDWWSLLVVLFLWSVSGPIAALSPFPSHLQFMMRIDELLGFGHDPVIEIQRHLAAGTHVNALDVLTSITYNLHVPEPYIAAYILWRMNRSMYVVFAASIVVLFVLGFVTFVVFPAAPPWVASVW
jgi:hypothetical protein